MFDYAQIRALAAVLGTGSFDAAAARLGVTPSAVSQRVKALEEAAGAALVRRAQPCTPTAAGARLARHLEAVELLEATLADDFAALAPAPQVALRIAVTADSLATWVLPALARLPDMLFDLVIDDQDHSADWLRRGEVLAAVTARAGPVAGCDSLALGALRYRATASPAFMARWFPGGVTPAALSRAPHLVFNAKDRLQARWLTQVAGLRAPPPAHVMGSTGAFVEAALLGIGWGMNPEPLVAAHLAAGRLVELMPDQPLDVALHWQTQRLMGPGVAPLTRAIGMAAAAVLQPVSP